MTNELPVSVARVETPEGARDVVTLLPPSVFFNQGLVPEAIVGSLLRPLQPHEKVTPDNFARNPVFVEFLHQFIAARAGASPELQLAARRQGTGWVYIIDRRTPTPAGDVPPEDMIGGFEVSEGRMGPESYRANPAHRILLSRGFFRLGPALEALLVEELTTRTASRFGAG